jgi:hypothetical protein
VRGRGWDPVIWMVFLMFLAVAWVFFMGLLWGRDPACSIDCQNEPPASVKAKRGTHRP